MSDDIFKDENPFARLDKKKFPDAGKKTKSHGANIPSAVQNAIPAPFPDDDAALFLNAVGNAVRVPSCGKTGRQKNDFGHKLRLPKREEKTLPPPPPAASQEQSEASSKTSESSFAELFARSLPPDARKLPRGLASAQPVPSRSRQELEETPLSAPSTGTDTEADSLFADAVRDVAPLAGKGRAVALDAPPLVSPPVTQNPLQEFMEGKVEFTLSSTNEYVEAHVVGLDLSIVGKLQNGQLSPEANIDLHGLNSEQAFMSLVGFMRNAYMCGYRTVLVVSGRGKNSPAGIGVLREKLQEWFTQEPFRRVILAFCTAKPADGGPGALYVLLRKFRKNKGKVHWDRRPVDPDLCL